MLTTTDRRATPQATEGVEATGSRGPTAVLVVLGAIAGCTAFGEGALTDWGALLLRQELSAPSTLAAAGYAGFSLAMAFGRLFGGRMLQTWGERRLLVGGTLLAAAGALAVVTTSTLWLALAGFVVVGLGLANVFPLAIARAGVLGGARGIALATTVGYTGLLGGPPAIGLLAEVAGLPVALGSVAVLAVAAAGLVLTLSGDAVRMPAPRVVVTRAGSRLQPLVAGVGHGAGAYARDLQLLVPALTLEAVGAGNLRCTASGHGPLGATRPGAAAGPRSERGSVR